MRRVIKKSEAIITKYFRAGDFPDDWELTAEIEVARYEKFDGDRGKADEHKMVVYFRRQKSGLVLNSTLWDQMIAVTGEEDSDNWPSYRVQLFRTTTPFGRETRPCIRVREAPPEPKKAKKVAPQPVEEDAEA